MKQGAQIKSFMAIQLWIVRFQCLQSTDTVQFMYIEVSIESSFKELTWAADNTSEIQVNEQILR